MKKSLRYVWLIVGLCVGLLMLLGPSVTLAAPQDAAPVRASAQGDAFSSGTKRLSVVVGNGYAFDKSYLLIGVGAAYFIANGLDLGLDFEYWTGSSPSITKVSPRLDYVFNTGGALRPYAGVFYRRTMIEGFNDLDSIGGRVGLYSISGKGVYIGAGLVYESYLSCDTAIYSSCSDTYPEFVIAFSF